jgi:cellulose synthase/poly-beta-1,6-N-acetylglucosamine synthase-like glycosyltransferase
LLLKQSPKGKFCNVYFTVNDLPFASIVIVTWNSAAHLPRCSASFFAQAFRNFEVILVDNGSTDDYLNGLENHWSGLTLAWRG